MVFCLLLTLGFPTAEERPIRASWEIARGPIYVGQGVEAHLNVVASATRPTTEMPKTESLDLVPLSGIEVRPLAATGIGDVVEVTNAYRIPVRIVPRRAGKLILPPIRIEADGRMGTVPPRTIAVRAAPTLGRTSAFLGGVGTVVASAEARPSAVRVGDPFEYRITLEGPGAVGSVGPPRLDGLDRLGLGIRVEPQPDEATVEPPRRTFRFRLRPIRAGDAAIPPFRVSWLDPATGSYRVTATRSVPIRVVDVPEFDPARVAFPDVSGRRANRAVAAAGVGLAGLLLAGGVLLFAKWRTAKSRKVNPRRIADGLASRVAGIEDPDSLVVAANEAVVEFFNAVSGRPPGVLTPGEARAWAKALTGRDDDAERAERLIAILDRWRYGEDHNLAAEEEPRAMTITLLKDLGKYSEAGKPREAPGTA